MKIEIWSDYVCPFCYIGKRRLEQAIEKKGLQDHVDVVFKSYELDMSAPATSEETTYESLARKYQTTVEAAKQMTDGVREQAKSVGLTYNFDAIRPANTRDAHRLVMWAQKNDQAKELSERLFHAYFIDAREIGRREVLLEIVKEAGLNVEEAKAMLETKENLAAVRVEMQEGIELGVRGVPFFVVNEKYAISGAQPNDVFEEMLEKVAAEEGIQRSKLQLLGDTNANVCSDDSCDI
ncbi:DsbA family oxidoreductase [Paenisporosarcina cavernae]|uniref:DsbA family oxidoreductase n=1 Tax=Paenisporosarcina cavernae TaxID=2320858 RepID=A0A385YU55_9BACL|nr:DsbA family oxidoreductase [Paenisporosarcina cavernae]AYC30405.1 DsbA family oxidoreductase [Paenisporosarcina cavernae]